MRIPAPNSVKKLKKKIKDKELQLTETEERNRRAAESARLKSEFLAKMSHELRTPLNAIIGFAELIQSEKIGALNNEQQEYLGDILVSSKYLLQLIDDVLDLSKIEAGRLEFRPEEVDVAQLVKDVVNVLEGLREKKKLYLTTSIDKESQRAFIYPSRFKQIIYNYLSNAIKFTPEYGSIEVRIISDKDNLRLEVEDNGIGIKEEDLNKLFIEFNQLDSLISKKYPGTGLGLSLTKHIVEAQGGNVGVKSTFGKGSVFYAVLPKKC